MKTAEFEQNTVDFLNIAYKDYLAARILLNAGLPLQGGVLASTAIEKYFKAILTFYGNKSHGHLKKSHVNAVKNFDPKLWVSISEEFVELLQRVYDLRYLDDLKNDFNVVIATREFLAELDYTAITIQEKFQIEKNGKEAILFYQECINRKDSRLYLNNHILSSIEKQTFISVEPQLIYEVRKCPLRGFFEISYLTKGQKSDGNFLRSGLTPKDTVGEQYQTAFLQI